MADKYMMVSSITNVLGQAKDCLVDLGESWIDAQLDDGLLKEIPIIKALMLGKNVIRTVTECHEIRQISQFLLTIDTECTDEARRKRYIKVLNENAKQFEKELEYVTIVVTNYLESEKPKMLGRLYLKRLDGGLSWDEFAKYAAAIDRIFPTDVEILKEHDFKKNAIMCKQSESEKILRLISVGFMYEQTASYYMGEDASEITDYETAYSITAFGQKFIDIVG